MRKAGYPRALLLAGALVSVSTGASCLAQDKSAQAPQALPAPVHGADTACIEGLVALGVEIDKTRAIAPPESEACAIAGPVVAVSVRSATDAGSVIRLPDRPLLACAMAARLAGYLRTTLDPLARESFGGGLASVGTGPGYECRTRNRQPGAKMSEHARGNAIDVMHMEFSGGRRFVVEKIEDAAQQEFLKRMLVTACAAFTTVLGPAADAFHRNNIHIDMEPRGRDGNTKFCQ